MTRVSACVRFVQYASSKNRLRGYELLPSAQHSIMNGWTIRGQNVCFLFQGTLLAVLQMCEKNQAELTATDNVAIIRPFYCTCFRGFSAQRTRSGLFCWLTGLYLCTGINHRSMPIFHPFKAEHTSAYAYTDWTQMENLTELSFPKRVYSFKAGRISLKYRVSNICHCTSQV